MFTHSVFWPWFVGLVSLILGLIVVRREVAVAPGLEKLVALGRIFFAVPLAVFGAEHLVIAPVIAQMVPAYMPARLFWAYFIGFALIAASLSIIFNRYVRLSATLLALMIFAFVLMIHTPRVLGAPTDRISWAVWVRDVSFASAAWLLARRPVTPVRLWIGLVLVFFGIEHFLHPECTPGVPLAKLTPSWLPLGPVWAYITGAASVVTGLCLLANRYARIAAIWLGLLLTVITVFIYGPILAEAQPSDLMEGVNYVADTLMFAGTILVLASALQPGALPNLPGRGLQNNVREHSRV